jgi:hypothetical protein
MEYFRVLSTWDLLLHKYILIPGAWLGSPDAEKLADLRDGFAEVSLLQ